METLTQPLSAADCMHVARLGIDAAERFNALSADSREALVSYAQDSDLIAMVLRGELDYVDENLARDAWQQILDIERAMRGLDRPVTLWRGTDTEHAEQMIAGGSESFVSATHDEAMAIHFAAKHAQPALVRIVVQAHHPLVLVPPYLFQSRDEGEVLLDRSTAFIQACPVQVHGHKDWPIYQLVTDGLMPYTLPSSHANRP
jgi:hypothetical protein